MRRVLAVLFVLVATVYGVLADDDAPEAAATGKPDDTVPAARELMALLGETGELPLADLTVGELLQMGDLASVARQQKMHIRKSGGLSLFVPGLGHYLNGEIGTALGFLAANLAIRTTAAVVGYILLPAPVKYSNLNYLQTPLMEIETRWKTLTPADLLPSAAVAATAAILSAIVRHIAARDARDLALQAIKNGSVTFEPLSADTYPGISRYLFQNRSAM